MKELSTVSRVTGLVYQESSESGFFFSFLPQITKYLGVVSFKRFTANLLALNVPHPGCWLVDNRKDLKHNFVFLVL